jgi:hypothetical protein
MTPEDLARQRIDAAGRKCAVTSRSVALTATFLATLATPAFGQAHANPRVELTIGAGITRPAVTELGTLYGNALLAIDAQGTFRLNDSNIGAFVGAATTGGHGDGLEVLGRSNLAGEVDFRQVTLRFGIGRGILRGSWAVHVAGGLRFDIFRERLDSERVEVGGHAVGILGQLAVRRRLGERVGLFGRAELTHPFTVSFDSGFGGTGRVGLGLGLGLAFLF